MAGRREDPRSQADAGVGYSPVRRAASAVKSLARGARIQRGPCRRGAQSHDVVTECVEQPAKTYWADEVEQDTRAMKFRSDFELVRMSGVRRNGVIMGRVLSQTAGVSDLEPVSVSNTIAKMPDELEWRRSIDVVEVIEQIS